MRRRVLLLLAAAATGGSCSNATPSMTASPCPATPCPVSHVCVNSACVAGETCDLGHQNCSDPGRTRCAHVIGFGNPECVPSGTLAEGAPCQPLPVGYDDCGAGLVCDAKDAPNQAAICRKACASGAGCPSSLCLSSGACFDHCALDGDQCGDGSSCRLGSVDTTEGAKPAWVCQQDGPGSDGSRCSQGADCGTGLACDSGVCKKGCDSVHPCAKGTCIAKGGLPNGGGLCACTPFGSDCPNQTSCRPVSDPASAYLCLPDGVGLEGGRCTSAGDCASNLACVEGVCRALCDSSHGCGGRQCDTSQGGPEGLCSPFPCDQNGICPQPLACVPGLGCAARDSCDPVLQDCTDPNRPKCTVVPVACAGCPTGALGRQCVPLTGRQPLGGTCTSSVSGLDDCDKGLICDAFHSPDGRFTCRRLCSGPGDCSGGTACAAIDDRNGLCESPCTLGAPCQAGLSSCRSRQGLGAAGGAAAVLLCSPDGPMGIPGGYCATPDATMGCGPGLDCVIYACARLCGPALACPSGEQCAQAAQDPGGHCACSAFSACLAGESCKADGSEPTLTGICTPDGSAGPEVYCHSNLDCPANQTCWGASNEGFYCRSACDAAHPCALGGCATLAGYGGICPKVVSVPGTDCSSPADVVCGPGLTCLSTPVPDCAAVCGAGQAACGSGSTCTSTRSGICSCTAFADCPVGTTCRPEGSASNAVGLCMPDGATPAGEPCNGSFDCAAGLQCWGNQLGHYCRAICNDAHQTCSATERCLPIEAFGGGICGT
jgi:hypothetical protein